MRAKGVDVADVEWAIEQVNAPGPYGYEGNVIARTNVRTADGCDFTLAVANGHLTGAKVLGIGSGRERSSKFACWHVFRDVLAVLFAKRPAAVIKTGMTVYEGAAGFLELFEETGRRNAGSQVMPVMAIEQCDCHSFDADGHYVKALRDMLAGS